MDIFRTGGEGGSKVELKEIVQGLNRVFIENKSTRPRPGMIGNG